MPAWAQAIAAGMEESHYFDLESLRDQLRLQNPELALGALTGLVVLDELRIVCPGDVTARLDDRIVVLGIARVASALA